MNTTISSEQLIKIVEQSDLDPTIKSILIRDISNEGASEFLIEQIIAYCDNAIEVINKKTKEQEGSKNPV